MESEVYKFKPVHTREFEPQNMQMAEWDAYQELEKNNNVSEWLEEQNVAITLEIDKKVASILGIIPLPQGGGHCWLFISKDVKGGHEMRLLTKCVLGVINGVKEYGYEWLQTPVRDDFKQGKRWVQMLGFSETEHKEDILGDGTTYTYWTRVL